MWRHPWGYKEGVAIGIGLILTGILLQITIGPLPDQIFHYPFNIVWGISFVVAIIIFHLISRKNKKLSWFSHMEASITSIASFLLLVIIMGFTRQYSIIPEKTTLLHLLGFTNMLSSWEFALTFVYMLTVLGLTIIRRISRFRIKKDIPFMLNHIGLFVALLAGVMGSAEIQRLTMVVSTDQPEWRAENEKGEMIELPLAIELHRFTIDEYPPKLMVIDNNTGRTLPEKQSVNLVVDSLTKSGQLMDWDITINEYLESAAVMVTTDSVIFLPYYSNGATTALHATVRNTKGDEVKSGWISCGSYAFPYRGLMLNKDISIVMPDREPRRFASEVSIYTQDERNYQTTIEVNKPFKVDGWKIYQLSYDETKGKWSNISKFELVKDPWSVPVYIGIILMILGAISMFVLSQTESKPERID